MNDQKDQKQTGTQQLFDPRSDNMPISDKTQEVVNKPIEDETGEDPKDQELANQINVLVDDKKIDLYAPSSLINEEVYNGLDDEAKGKVDLQAYNMLSTIRGIHDFHNSDFPNGSYQFKNMVHKLRLQKEETEKISGDVYKF